MEARRAGAAGVSREQAQRDLELAPTIDVDMEAELEAGSTVPSGLPAALALRGVVAAGAAIRPAEPAEGAHRATAPRGSALVPVSATEGRALPPAALPEPADDAEGRTLVRRDRGPTLSPTQKAETNAALQRAAAAVRALVPTPAPTLDPRDAEALDDPDDDPPARAVQRTVTHVHRLDVSPVAAPPGSGLGPRVPFKPLSVATLVLLFGAVALPTPSGPPWALLGDPGGVTFVALATLLLVLVAHILPVGPRARGAVATAVGALALGLSLVVADSAIGADLFDGQPAVGLAFAGPIGARAVLLSAALLLPFALHWRQSAPGSAPARAVHVLGVSLVLFAAFGLGALTPSGAPPLPLALDVARTSPLLGDRLVAAVSLLPILLALLSLFTLIPRIGTRRLAALAVGYWVTVAAPLIVGSLFVARSDAWMDVLAPLKVTTFILAALLYLPVAAAAWLPAPAQSAGGAR